MKTLLDESVFYPAINGRRLGSTRSSNKAAAKQQKQQQKNRKQQQQKQHHEQQQTAKAAAKPTRTARKTAHNKKSQHQAAATMAKNITKSNKSSANILEGQKRQGCVFNTTTGARRPECGGAKPRSCGFLLNSPSSCRASWSENRRNSRLEQLVEVCAT